MSDGNTTDDANLSELTDADKLGGEYPPEEPMGVDEYGTTPGEETMQEPLEERVLREEPDTPLAASPLPTDEVGDLVDPEAGGEPDVTAEAVASEVPEVDRGDIAVGDLSSGDETRRDVAQEQAGPPPAEEAAMHLTDEPPMGDGDGYIDDEPG